MSSLAFFFRTAWRNLLRGGQRMLVALFCIAFGVMSLTALMMVSESFEQAVVLDPSEQIGADISLSRIQEEYISEENIRELDDLRAAGKIDNYTLIALTSRLALRTPGSGELHFVSNGMGIDPDVYPLAGRLLLGEPGNTGPATLLQDPGDIIVTFDVANEYHLHTGDPVILADFQEGIPVKGSVRGIANDTPNHQGSKVYYSHETARLLTGGRPAANTAMVNTTQAEAVASQLTASGWNVFTSVQLASNSEEAQALLATMLTGAGILGMLVGGIGIANTMQVLLRRRQKEVAVWKALGYREGHLQALFAFEALLLGMIGSLFGAGLGLLVSTGLLQLFVRTSNLLIAWTFSPYPLLIAGSTGVITTLIFSMWAIVSASQAQPLALLRNEPVTTRRMPAGKVILLAVALGVPFCALTSLLMGSIERGAGILVFALLGLVFIGGSLGAMVRLATRLLPLKSIPLARMAQTSLRRRGKHLVFAMIALFAGVLSIGLAVVVTGSAQDTMDTRRVTTEGDNIQVIAPARHESRVKEAIAAQGIDKATYAYKTMVDEIGPGSTESATGMDPVLIGLEEPGDYQIDGAAWGSQPEGVYTFRQSEIPEGSQVEVRFLDGSTRSFNVVGTYDVAWSGATPPPQLGLLMTAGLAAKVSQPDTVIYYLQAPAGKVYQVSTELGKALPDLLVINLVAYATRFAQQVHNLFVLALAMAGLALLAGALLVANSVSLAMLDRRYEIGVLKAVGYSQSHILASLAVEYSLVALIATIAGLFSVQLFVWIMGLLNRIAGNLLVLSPGSAAIILLSGIGLVLITVLAVSWGATRQSPAIALNDR